MIYFNYNGKTYKEGMPVMGVAGRGLRYGDGVFETIRCRKGALLFANEHFARLWKGMQVLRFDIPRHFTPEQLEKQVQELLAKNSHLSLARVRLTITRGEGGLYDALNHFPQYSIESWALPEGNGEWNSNGLVLGIYEGAGKSIDVLGNLKHNNFLPYVLAALQAKKEKWNDAVVLNSNGRVCDTTIANLFYIKEGIVYTPALGEACIAGVMRGHVLEGLSGNGWTCVEKPVTVTELSAADEIFLTNSISNMRWVQRIGENELGHSETLKIYTALHSTF